MFTGLKAAKSKHISKSSHVGGEPCIHEHHYQDDLGFRQGTTQACLDCLHELEKPTLNLCPTTLRPEAEQKRISFWSKVDITDFDDCWSYNYRTAKNENRFMWRRPLMYSNYRFHPIRVAIWLSWGDIGLMETRSICGERHCVNPLHNIPACITDKQLRELDINKARIQLRQLKRDIVDFHKPKLDIQEPKLVYHQYERAFNQALLQQLNVRQSR